MGISVTVGSLNPVKIAAARAVLRRVYGPDVNVQALAVASGVSAQPWGDEETRHGALNRARAARQQTEADFGVGIEGGLLEVAGEIYTSAWCVMVRRDGVTGLAGGENMLLPATVVEKLRTGQELGLAIDAVTGAHNSKQQGGAIGAFTAGWLSRQTAYEHLLTLALARFLQPAYYVASLE
ncbi:MAG TPA: inosine/xanthosine triphosphatase [Thermoflexia bacterium]|nr:inosine/xanthosine triphosphatase [Thermoflexia bacterium]